MAVLNHHVVASRSKETTSLFFADVLGLEAPFSLGEFAVLRVTGDTTLDFVDVDGDIPPLHEAFLVSEAEFDEILGRLERRGLTYWSDPMRSRAGEINTCDDGRGVYFDDPDGHLREIITRPFGSGGTEARQPHPLVAATIEPDDQRPGG